VAIATPERVALDYVAACVEARVPAAACLTTAQSVGRALQHDAAARAAGVTIAAGAGFAPGLVDVLARHAAGLFDVVDEIRVASTGSAGGACIAAAAAAFHEPASSWRDGREHTPSRADAELVWFPDPIGARDCRLQRGALPLLVDAFPDARNVSIHVALNRTRRLSIRRSVDSEWGAARCEVWGRRGTETDVAVYGVVERTSVAAATVLAITATQLAGVGGPRIDRPGVHGLAALVSPLPFLDDLARRGVRAAAFEGAPIA
jgi:hypothetical protein